ncbi:hypothetical protein SD960_10495 [Flavobacterium sp. MMLR14_040]|nr:hypothetical protein [Flavobacterium sp. MMLR14_040]MDW8850522.1 hypothetical protein [Flavobacterium sp. MMLR14_040]
MKYVTNLRSVCHLDGGEITNGTLQRLAILISDDGLKSIPTI